MEENSYYCSQCGTKIEPSMKFCSNCGSKVNIISPKENAEKVVDKELVSESDARSDYQNSSSGVAEIGGKKKIPLKIVIPIIIALIGLLYILKVNFLGNSNDDPDIGLKIENVSFDFLVEDELIPTIAYAYAMGDEGMIKMTVTNNTDKAKSLVAGCEIPGWTNPFESSFTLKKNGFKELNLKLSFLEKLKQNKEIVDAQINYYIKENGVIIWNQSKSIKISSKGTMLWSKYADFDMIDYVSGFVNPNDVKVEEIVSRAKEYAPDRNLIGYQFDDDEMQAIQTRKEARAIFLALHEFGISYVNSPMSYSIGHSQKVRTPFESIRDKSANCIDGAILYASIFENLGMEPMIIIGPGHAIVGVRLYPNSADAIYIETTLTGSTDETDNYEEVSDEEILAALFNRACEKGGETYNEWLQNDEVQIVDIKDCRSRKIFPTFTN
jgi:DNA-directed RNA polymerase subunit RPC12/RpoP